MLCLGERTGKHTEKWQFRKNGNLGESSMARLPDTENEQSKVTTVLRAIGNSKRLRILNELADGGERSVSELEAIISNLSQSALSQHLSRLRRANIVRSVNLRQFIIQLRILTFCAFCGCCRISMITTR